MTEPAGAAPVVTVRGDAQLEGPPDLATLTLTLHASGDSAEQTRGQLAEGSVTVAELLQGYEAAIERSSTSGVHVAPVFNRRTPTKIIGYQGTFTTQIVVSDFEFLSPLVLALTTLSNSQLDGPWWSLRADNPMYREARLAAIARRSPPRRRLCGGLRHNRGGSGRGVRSEYRIQRRSRDARVFDGQGSRRHPLRVRAGDTDGVGPSDRAIQPEDRFAVTRPRRHSLAQPLRRWRTFVSLR